MISQQDKDKILQATQIYDVVSAFIPLKKRGANYIGLCPFHNEKTPSFNVNPSRGIFKCFGCGEGGDSVSFLMKYQHYTYPEALRWLANRYGIEIEEKELTQQEKQEQDEKDQLYNINEFAQKYFNQVLLNDEEGKSVGLSYFNEREINQKTIDTWGLGYCKSNYDDFTKYALKHGYTEDLLIKSGLTIKSEKTNSLYDRFHGRVTFPIYNIGNRVLGFSARILTKEKTKAKYVNSPESPIYTKGKVLFGLNFAKNDIVKNDLCYLVEGNVDAIMMYQNEVKNVVATSGTALTNDQILLIKRYTTNIVILYDGDAAGVHAAIRATDMFLQQGLKIKIILFPDNDDPDSYARKHTQDEFQEFLHTNAQDFITYKTNLLLSQAQDDPIKKSTLTKDILHSISLIPDIIERSTYIQQTAKLLEIKEEILTNELTKQIIHNNFQTQHQAQQPTTTPNPTTEIPTEQPIIDNEQTPIANQDDESQELAVISLIVNNYETTTHQNIINTENKIETIEMPSQQYIINELLQDNITFNNPLYQQILTLYIDYYQNNQDILPLHQLLHHSNPEIPQLVSRLIVNPYQISALWEDKYHIHTPLPDNQNIIDQQINQTLLHLKLHKIEHKLTSIYKEIKQSTSQEDSLIFLSQLRDITKLRNLIANELHIRIK
ncbi:MAG: DNA primase [Bacteroidales bacterium]|jgi:DNA primase|nr:DNA primase [Bacteroidales bacterium]